MSSILDLPPRRIIVACDATDQSSTWGEAAISTNVNRFCHALSSEGDVEQIVYYQSGVGAGLLGRIFQAFAGKVGQGFDDNVLDAYQFLATNYKSGDEIFLFGFSRGAFTARVLASFILHIGLLHKSHSSELQRAYNAFLEGPDVFSKFRDGLISSKVVKTKFVDIKVVGCWDTVGSVGFLDYWFPRGGKQAFKSYDTTLSSGIENAFHALALDEVRFLFSPTIFHIPKDIDGDLMAGTNLQQCWFPGVHTNVGGGYQNQHLADLTLAWMIDKCRPFLDFDQTYLDKVCGLDHNSNVPKGHDEWLMDSYMDIPDYYGMGIIYDSFWDDPMFMLGFSPRTPGAYEGRIQDRKVIGRTNEEIHISVRERYQKDSLWRPRSLYGFKPVHDEERQRWKWVGVKHGQPVTIWEAEFEDDVGNFEHLLSDRFYMLGEYDKEG